MKKCYAKAAKDLDQAIGLDPKNPEALNSRAWMAAVCPDAAFRDARKALEYAWRACELDGWKNAYFLGTLAAACAANGDYAEAVKRQQKALEDPAYRRTHGEEGRRMLKLFQHGRPYREGEPARSQAP
jgi:tetratricopeptide (TPR) repeat protein